MSFPRPGCSAREDCCCLLNQGLIEVCGLGSKRRILTGTVLCALNSALGETPALLWVRAPENTWDLTLTLSLPRTGTLHRNLSLLRSLILNLSRLLAWALTSALGGHHETGVASDEATSQDRTLTLAKSLSSGDPTPTSDSITCLGSRSGAG